MPQRPEHLTYAEDVVTGRIPAPHALVLAAQRSLDDHAAAASGPYEWRSQRVRGLLRFLEAGRAPVTGERLELMPWQTWFVSEVFGWVNRVNGERRFSEALLYVAKKNGKSTLLGLLMLYEVRFRRGAEVYSAATRLEQASICLTEAAKILPTLPARARAGLQTYRRDRMVTTIVWTDPAGIAPVASVQAVPRGQNRDGPNPSLLVFDEAAAIQDDGAFADLMTASGRRDRLTLYITTAQAEQSDSPFASRLDYYRAALLEGRLAEHVFLAIWELESEKEVADPDLWVKANPGLGRTCHARPIAEEWAVAEHDPVRKPKMLAKNFNVRQPASDAWMDMREWDACETRELPHRIIVGLDAGYSDDLTSVCLLGRDGTPERPLFTARWQCFCPERSLMLLPAEGRSLYDAAIEDGELIIAGEGALDVGVVLAWMEGVARERQILVVGLDRAYARSLQEGLVARQMRLATVEQVAKQLTGPITEIDDAVRDGRLYHSHQSFVRWQIANARLWRSPDRKNVRLNKRVGSMFAWRKIDAADALVDGVCTALREPWEAEVRHTRISPAGTLRTIYGGST